MLVLPATTDAAGTCSLKTASSPGHEITVTGSGFDPNTAVDVSQTWSGSNATAGGNTGPKTTRSQVTSDAAGAFTFTVDAGPGRGGTYDFEATAGGCTATTTATALETAGGLNTGAGGAGGITATPPATDTAPPAERGTGVPLPLAPLGAVVLGGALVALAWALRRARIGQDRLGR